ncbi:hypothetical protein ACFQO4_09520 [Saliphagus sp. GCM10025334]
MLASVQSMGVERVENGLNGQRGKTVIGQLYRWTRGIASYVL